MHTGSRPMRRADRAVPHREALPAACSDFVGSYTFSTFVMTLSSNGIVSSRLINPTGRAQRSLVLLATEQSFCGLRGWPCHALRPVPKRPPSRRTIQLRPRDPAAAVPVAPSASPCPPGPSIGGNAAEHGPSPGPCRAYLCTGVIAQPVFNCLITPGLLKEVSFCRWPDTRLLVEPQKQGLILLRGAEGVLTRHPSVTAAVSGSGPSG